MTPTVGGHACTRPDIASSPGSLASAEGAGSTVAYGRGFTWCNHDDGRAGIAVGLAGLCAELLVLGQASELGISIDAEKIEELRRHGKAVATMV
jgi:hypothetical protein